MIKITTIINIALFTFVSAAAQPTFIGIEALNISDIYKVDDPAGYIKAPLLNAEHYGLKVRHVVAGPLFLEAGLYVRDHNIGFSFKNKYETGGTGRQAFWLPLRAGLRFPLFKKHLYIAPVGGFVLAMTDNQEGGSGNGAWTEPGGDRLEYNYTLRYPVKTYFLLQGGLGIDIRIFRRAFLSILGNYYAGMNKLWIQDLHYTVNGVEYNAKGYVKSSYSFGIGFSYQIGKNENRTYWK
jgi:hypothetical protein